ncbi:MAG: carboxypeptidase regulatory-like domain-containing protein, partial [Bacteroidia bacterium]
MKKVYLLLFALFNLGLFANAQSQLGEIRGKVIDSKTKKPMDFVSVSIYLNGVLKATAVTDDEGGYIVKALQPGAYEIRVAFIGYRNTIVKNVTVSSDNIRFENIYMESNEGGTILKPVEIIAKTPLIDPSGTAGQTIDHNAIMKSPTRSVNMLANTTAGVDARSGGTPSFRGARADGTAYYIDGFKVTYGSTALPAFAVDQIQVLTGGTPAQYGDFIGGVIA